MKGPAVRSARKTKTTRQKTTDKLDKLWAQVVKLRAGNRCEMCGKTGRLNSHHIYSRSNLRVRWHIPNGVCLCAGCHALGNYSAHKAPADFMDWLEEERGTAFLDKLRERAHGTLGPAVDIAIEDEKKLKLELKKFS